MTQANPAARELLRSSPAALAGMPLIDIFDKSSTILIARSIATARATGAADEVTCRVPGNERELRAKISIFHTGNDSFLLVRLTRRPDERRQRAAESPVFDAIAGASVGFLLTDSGLRIEYANQAFTDLIDLALPTEVRGKSLVQWLRLTTDDLTRLQNQMLHREATSLIAARLHSEVGSWLDVEVCAVAVPDGEQACWGFIIRELPQLN